MLHTNYDLPVRERDGSQNYHQVLKVQDFEEQQNHIPPWHCPSYTGQLLDLLQSKGRFLWVNSWFCFFSLTWMSHACFRILVHTLLDLPYSYFVKKDWRDNETLKLDSTVELTKKLLRNFWQLLRSMTLRAKWQVLIQQTLIHSP